MARITEQELANVVRIAGELEAMAITASIGTVAARLVGEVRRLRGLLDAVSPALIRGFDGTGRDAFNAAQAEVEAIRAERS